MSNTKATVILSAGAALLAVGTVLLIKHLSAPQAGGNKKGNGNNPPPPDNYASPGNDYILGKTAYATTDNVHVWEKPIVDYGYWWDVTGLSSTSKYDIPKGNIAGWITEGPMPSQDTADKNKWYKVRVYTVAPSPALDYGYVREDVIEIK